MCSHGLVDMHKSGVFYGGGIFVSFGASRADGLKDTSFSCSWFLFWIYPAHIYTITVLGSASVRAFGYYLLGAWNKSTDVVGCI